MNPSKKLTSTTLRPLTRRTLTCSALLALALPLEHAAAEIKSADNPEANPVWKKVRASLFQSRPIAAASDDVISLVMPVRAEDAAIVPIAIHSRLRQTPERYIDKVWLIIDNNPSPISAIFQFTPLSGRADIETRVRVDEYTHIRAIAETNDGKLQMATAFVKASGGCSAPPAKDAEAALKTLGRMKLSLQGPADGDQPQLAQLMISHPNNSGLALDQVTRLYTPAHFVRQVNISYAGQKVMSADVDFSISENPNFRFYFVPRGEGELKAEVVDSHDLQFQSTLKYRRPE
jgi:sulfur-oxidizing protein SoxY